MNYVNKILKTTLLALLILLNSAIWSGESATLNLKDADIRVLIDTVSEVTGKNFVIDPRVKAKVTVVSSKAMDESELYSVFLSILQVHGFSTIDLGDIIKIVPDVTAKQGPVPTASYNKPYSGDQLVTRVIAIQHVPAAQLVPILRPLIPQQGQLAAYQPSNSLVISDRAANVKRLINIINRIDRPDQSDIEVIELQHAPAADIARTLSGVIRQTSQGGPGAPGAATISPDERTNSLLISGDKATRLRIRGIIARLDTALATGGDTQVVFLKYAMAEDLVQILTGVSKSNMAATSTTTNTTKTATGGNNPKMRQPVRRNVANTAGSKRNDANIQADVANNALVITASPSVMQELKRVIAQLDIRRTQVMIEAIIAEVTLDLAKDLGTSFAMLGATQSGENRAPAIVTNLGNLTNTVLSLTQGATGGIPAGAFLGGGNFSRNGNRFGMLLKALAGDSATNILSTPTLVTLDNEEAEIVVGKNVPFLTGSYTNTGASSGASNPFQTIERRDIGLTLRVKPQVNEGTGIKLEIHQESSSLAASSTGATDLITNTRSIKTTVMADDGQVIVLGGLMDDTFTDSQEKVPLLGDIPIFGHLFKSTSTKKIKTSLMVFIRPVILRDAASADAYTRQKYSHFRARQQDAGIDRRGLIKDSFGRLPDLDELITQLPDAGSEFISQLPE